MTLVAGIAYCEHERRRAVSVEALAREVLERSLELRRDKNDGKEPYLVGPGVLEERAGLVTRQDAGLCDVQSGRYRRRGFFGEDMIGRPFGTR